MITISILFPNKNKIIGDFNSRMGILPDMSHNDESVEFCKKINSDFNVRKRSNKDNCINKRGRRLIELCNGAKQICIL